MSTAMLHVLAYCKRCYFHGINFSRLAAQKHIRGLLNLHWADAHLSFLYCTKLTSFNEWYIYKYVCNWAAQKQSSSQTDSSILPICINTHGQYTTSTCPKCAYKISQIFSQVFEFALTEFCVKFAKINVPQIFPLLQYVITKHNAHVSYFLSPPLPERMMQDGPI